jgi:thiamine kinase-like enzyme
VHLDLHPENVIVTARGPVLIDWRNARSGSPDLDLALSGLILAEVGTDHAMDVAPAARLLLRLFLDRVGAPPQRALEAAVAMRRADPALSGAEVDRLGDAAALVRAT